LTADMPVNVTTGHEDGPPSHVCEPKDTSPYPAAVSVENPSDRVR
jgi:hypothetical protein